jgi:hypothetical protein
VCVCVCVLCVCMSLGFMYVLYIYTCVCVCVCVYYVYACIYVCMYICMCVRVYVSIGILLEPRSSVHAHAHVRRGYSGLSQSNRTQARLFKSLLSPRHCSLPGRPVSLSIHISAYAPSFSLRKRHALRERDQTGRPGSERG